MKFFDIEKKIKDIESKILEKENKVLNFKKEKNSFIAYSRLPEFINQDIENAEGEIKVLKQEREHLLEQRREGFANKVFWSIVVPIVTTIITTILIQIIMK